MTLYTILKKPITTEKTSRLELAHNRYGFIVDKKATKIDIKKAVKEIYWFDVSEVNVTYVRGKVKMGKKGEQTRRSEVKKAYLTLKDKKAKLDFSIVK